MDPLLIKMPLCTEQSMLLTKDVTARSISVTAMIQDILKTGIIRSTVNGKKKEKAVIKTGITKKEMGITVIISTKVKVIRKSSVRYPCLLLFRNKYVVADDFKV